MRGLAQEVRGAGRHAGRHKGPDWRNVNALNDYSLPLDDVTALVARCRALVGVGATRWLVFFFFGVMRKTRSSSDVLRYLLLTRRTGRPVIRRLSIRLRMQADELTWCPLPSALSVVLLVFFFPNLITALSQVLPNRGLIC